MKLTKEQSRSKFVFTFENEEGVLFVPDTVRWRLDDKTCGLTEVLPWQSAAAALTVEILVPADANRILNDANPTEIRLLTVQSDFGTENQLSQELEYPVENLEGFTS